MTFGRILGRWFLGFVLWLCVVATAQAQTITLFEDVGFKGKREDYRTAIRLLPGPWNDRASSLRVSGRWEVCRHEDFRDCRTVSSDVGDLRRLDLNDEISSLRPIR